MNQEIDPLVEAAAQWISEDHGYYWEELTSNPLSSQIVALYRFKSRSLLQAIQNWRGEKGEQVVVSVGCRNPNPVGCGGCVYQAECEDNYVDNRIELPLIGKEGE